jgi:protein-S-isoprenylcysteine O-methyltransferase Ste14
MQHELPLSIQAAWIAVGLVWAVAAIPAKPAVRVEPRESRVGHIVTFAVALTLLFSPVLRVGPLAWRLLPPSGTSAVAGAALTIAGILLAIWARFYLGGNWSAAVAIKDRHTLVRTGPYSVVRHPIYAALLLAMFGTALVLGELGGFLSVILAFAGWNAKARLEEYFLLAQFGEAYRSYRRQVKAMIPFVL